MIIAALGVAASLLAAAPACPPAGMTRAGLMDLKARGFEMASAKERDAMAMSLLSCLDDPDPAVRDGVVFEGLQKWLRGKLLSPPVIQSLADSLKRTLEGEPDAQGFRHPFAALTLSEVARADRIEPFLTEESRAALVDLAARNLVRVRDYRGLDTVSGWRHGVAHGADLILQMGVNPRVDALGLKTLMDAVAAQVAPAGPVFYTFGEPERLARAVNFTYRRSILEAAYWEAWFVRLAQPAPLASWDAAFLSVDGMARRHNTLSLLHALSYAGRTAADDRGRALAALADKAAAAIIGN